MGKNKKHKKDDPAGGSRAEEEGGAGKPRRLQRPRKSRQIRRTDKKDYEKELRRLQIELVKNFKSGSRRRD
jgi:hypothetical protein